MLIQETISKYYYTEPTIDKYGKALVKRIERSTNTVFSQHEFRSINKAWDWLKYVTIK